MAISDRIKKLRKMKMKRCFLLLRAYVQDSFCLGALMTYHLNSAPFLHLHRRRHCQSQDIIFICLLYPSPPGPSTQNLNLISSITPTLTILIIPPPHLNNTHPNSYSVPSWYFGNRT